MKIKTVFLQTEIEAVVMSQRSKRIVGGILLLIFTTYYVNITFFAHSHILNGVTIVHSHFHDKAHAQKGTHSESELTLISALSDFQSLTAISFFVLPAGLFLLTEVVRIFSERVIASNPVACISLRAPPFYIA